MRAPQRPRARRLWRVLDVAADVLACGLLVTIAGLLLWSTAPLALGWRSDAVVSGSMVPHVRIGDVVVTSPTDGADVVPGQVILFPDPTGVHRTLVHRIDSVDEEGRLITRGDANASADSTPLERSAVLGVGRLRVPFVGLPRIWWQTRDLPRLAALTLLLTAAAAVLIFPRQGHRGDDEAAPRHDIIDGEPTDGEPADPPPPSQGTTGTAASLDPDVPGLPLPGSTFRRIVTVAVGTVVVLAPITHASAAEAAFTRTTTTDTVMSFTAGHWA